MIVIDSLNAIQLSVGVITTSVVDVLVFDAIRSLIYGDVNGSIQYEWSADGVNFVYSDTVNYLAGVGITNSMAIKGRYLRIVYTNSAYPANLKIQHLFQLAPPSLSTLGNLGAGTVLYNGNLSGVKSFKSDGSVAISHTDTEITVAGASGMVAGANSDVQVTHGAGVYSVGIAKGAQTGPNSLYITGTDTSASTGVNDFCCCYGEGVGATGLVDGASVVSGYEAAGGGCGVNCVLLGYQAGKSSGTGKNKIAIGYRAADTAQGDGSISIGYQQNGQSQGSSAVSIGSNAGLGQGNNSVAVGVGAAGGVVAQGANCVAIGNGAGSTGQVAASVAIGYNAGNSAQAADSVAIGSGAGQTSQANFSVAVGKFAAQTNQGANSVAVGRQAAYSGTYQGARSVAVGDSAAGVGQGTDAVAIGYRASFSAAQPNNSVAIGASCVAPGAVGRLAFGNAMEAIATTATAGAQVLPANPSGFIRLEWNGTLYKVPVYNN